MHISDMYIKCTRKEKLEKEKTMTPSPKIRKKKIHVLFGRRMQGAIICAFRGRL